MLQTGDIIKRLRIENKYTQNELAIMLGLQLSTLQKYESGAIQNLKLDTLRELCEIFEVPPIVFVFPNYQSKPNRIFEWMLENQLNLNAAGVKKVRQYVDDILKIQDYTR